MTFFDSIVEERLPHLGPRLERAPVARVHVGLKASRSDSRVGRSVGTMGRFQSGCDCTFRRRRSRSWASPIRPSARMMSCSRWAIVTSVWTMSIGASAPTSILIFVIRLRSFARSRASFFGSQVLDGVDEVPVGVLGESGSPTGRRARSRRSEESREILAWTTNRSLTSVPKLRRRGCVTLAESPLVYVGLMVVKPGIAWSSRRFVQPRAYVVP